MAEAATRRGTPHRRPRWDEVAVSLFRTLYRATQHSRLARAVRHRRRRRRRCHCRRPHREGVSRQRHDGFTGDKPRVLDALPEGGRCQVRFPSKGESDNFGI